MLSLDEYQEALTSAIQGALDMGPTPQTMAMMAGWPKLCWELTRPDTTCVTVDLTHRLSEYEGLTDFMRGLKVVVIHHDDGSPLMGYATGLMKDGADMFSPNDVENRGQAEFLQGVILEELAKLGINIDTPGTINLGDKMKRNTEKTIDDEVAAFSSELDSLLQTWEGGES